MSRSGYVDSDGGDDGDALRVYGWQANVKRCVNGRKGQAFMWELYLSLEAISSRQLVKSTLIDSAGQVCSLGSVAVTRGMEIPERWRSNGEDDPDDYEFAEAMGPLFGLKDMLAREVMYQNDDADASHYVDNGLAYGRLGETWQHDRKTRPETATERWQRMRDWVVSNLKAIP